MMCSNALHDDVMRLRVARSRFSFFWARFQELAVTGKLRRLRIIRFTNNLFKTEVENFLPSD